MALGTYTRNVYAVDVLVAISVSVTFFVYIPGMIWMMCCTSYVFVVVHKVKIASSAQNKVGLPTKYIIYMVLYSLYILLECSRSRTEV